MEGESPALISRFRRSQGKKKKPMKIVIHNQKDKEKIQNNLRNLKVNFEYKGVSVIEDYTVSVRQIIKEFDKKAKEKNSLELENSHLL